LLNGALVSTLGEVAVPIEDWRRHYGWVRPHSGLGYQPPAPQILPAAMRRIGSGAGQMAVAHRCSTPTTRGRLMKMALFARMAGG
jgi:hypothetical protein